MTSLQAGWLHYSLSVITRRGLEQICSLFVKELLEERAARAFRPEEVKPGSQEHLNKFEGMLLLLGSFRQRIGAGFVFLRAGNQGLHHH